MVHISWAGRAGLSSGLRGAEVSRKRGCPRPYAAIQQPGGKSRGDAGDEEELERSGLDGPRLCGRFGGPAEETDHQTPEPHQCNVRKEQEPTEEWRQPGQ